MLVNAKDACLVVFNMQLDLIPLLHGGTQLLNDCCWMTEVSSTFGLPRIIIEHKRLGKLSRALDDVSAGALRFEKTYFDLTRHDDIVHAIEDMGRTQVVLCGAESHVCLFQSALGLRQIGKETFVVSDAISARNMEDHRQAIIRFSEIGAHLITKEMFFFECVRYSEHPEYIGHAMKFLDGRYIR